MSEPETVEAVVGESERRSISPENQYKRSIFGLPVNVVVSIGQKKLSVAELLKLKPDTIIPLTAKIDDPIELLVDDVRLFDLEKSDLIISYYTMLFIPPRYRQDIFDKIYESLNWGGAFIMFEKVRGPDARFQDMMSALYNDFKTEQGFSAEEILSKTGSLKGILEPFSTAGNTDLLKRAGFVDQMTIFKHICFEGFVAIK